MLNGDLGTVVSVDPDHETLTVRLDRDPETRELPGWYLDQDHVGLRLRPHRPQSPRRHHRPHLPQRRPGLVRIAKPPPETTPVISSIATSTTWGKLAIG